MTLVLYIWKINLICLAIEIIKAGFSLKSLSKIVADDIPIFFFNYFSETINGISSQLSVRQMIHMKCQT